MTAAPQIPGYTFVDHLGSGGFADVYLYEQDWPRQRVAVKIVRPDVPLTEREKGLFTSEANAMARLADHPYIVSVITAGMTEGRPFLVMRYCPPPDLGVRVRAAPMSVADALSTGIKLASAIETAHRSGIVHRDIKPSNVLITTYQEPALSDFGIAGHLHDVEGDHEVRISYPWSPPELLDGRSNGSVASDVYSLGATFWNLLVGRSPFAIPSGDNTSRALTARILHASPPPTHRPDVPPALDRLLQQCLAKQAAHRPQSALELARSLQRIESTLGLARTPIAVEGDRTGVAPDATAGPDEDATHLKPATVVPSAAAPVRSASGDVPVPAQRRSAVIWAVLGVVVVAVVGTLLVMNASNGRDEDPGEVATGPTTPLSLDPNAPAEPPRVSGTREPEGVRFSWRLADGGQAGDTWEWKRTDTGESQRTERQSLVIRADARICLQVRVIRGTYASAWAEDCVD